MSKPLADDLFKLETEGVLAYDAALDVEVLVIAPVLCILCDNPRHSEIMNHAGTSANMYCRMCMVSSITKQQKLVTCTLIGRER
jgi:hypothetical protein